MTPVRPATGYSRLVGAALLAFTLTLAACGGGGEAAPAAAAAPAARPMAPAPLAAPARPSAVQVQLDLLPDDVDVPNPARGFYRWGALDLDTLNTPASIAVFENDARAAYSDGFRILYARIRLDAFRDTAELPSSLLDAVRAGFGAARRAGVKLVPRFVYNDGPAPGAALADDAPLEVVLAHLRQLKRGRVLSDNADAIAFMQAGFIGAWGEWHSSSHHLTETALEPDAMPRILDAVFDALPRDLYVQVRNPQHWPALYPSHAARPGSRENRTGLHNDCFLASNTDVGTYSSDPVLGGQQRAFVAAQGRHAPFGAETCAPPAPAEARMACDDILAEGRRYALTYLHIGYYQPFIDGWKAQGCFERIKATLGYRLRYRSVAYAAQAARGQAFVVDFTVDNAGWARVYRQHDAKLLLRQHGMASVIASRPMLDPGAWLPSSGSPLSYAETLSVKVPTTAAPGLYDVCIALPDSRTPADARTSIRPANADNLIEGRQWDAQLGAFCVGSVALD